MKCVTNFDVVLQDGEDVNGRRMIIENKVVDAQCQMDLDLLNKLHHLVITATRRNKCRWTEVVVDTYQLTVANIIIAIVVITLYPRP
jgi:hypothetical protein